jgi:hypothetical protein
LRKRLILLVPLLALFAFVAMTEERAEAADTTPPQTTITSGPSGSLTGTTATFEFTSSETGSTFLCKLVGRDSTRTNCGSPKTYTNLAVGTTYTFKVWAKDAAGNIDTTPATLTFTPSGSGGTPPPPSDCENDITPGEDLDAIINNDASGTSTTFCVRAGTYQVSAPAILKAGDKLKGQPGTKTTVDTATKPTPVVKLVGSGTDNLLRANGSGISISWVDLTGASGTGTGSGAIAAGSAGSDFVVEYSRIHDNASLGISNMNGTVRDSEFFKNSNAQSSLGFNGSAVKGITEFEAARVYVHDEQGNGFWCDVGCKNSARTTMTPKCPTGCFWVHDSVVVNSGRAGIRYENSPNEALFENNEIHGNGKTERRGGIDIRDSQNAWVGSGNNFGPATIAGVTYLVNGDRIGVRATDSGRSDRVNLSNVDVVGNTLNGETITGCEQPDNIVACSGN